MEPDNPLNLPGSLSDEELRALFRGVETPAPSDQFVARTMRAVRREPLPAGRRALRNPLTSLAGWAAVVAGVALSSLMLVLSHPIFASGLTSLVSHGVRIGMSMMQFVRDRHRGGGRVQHNRPRRCESRGNGGRYDRSRVDGCRVRAVTLGSAPAARF